LDKSIQAARMHFYFSGISSKAEFSMLQEAGVSRLLVDSTDLSNINWKDNPDVVLDSGAYRLFKEGRSILDVSTTGSNLAIDLYLQTAIAHPFTHVIAPDVIGDMQATLKLWNQVKYSGIPFVPVWQWGSDEKILYQLLDEAPLVGIGGCVPWMRVDNSRKRSKQDIQADEERRKSNFQQLQSICKQHGDRLHVFGLCWVKAIEELADCLYSADSSHWLVGARKGAVIFKNSRTGHLSQAPAGVLSFASSWDRRQRCVENARAIAQFLGESLTLV
jgi:hypothetical protein